MEIKADVVICVKCGKPRERFLVGCPQCGTIENIEAGNERKRIEYYQITLDVIKQGADWYKKTLEDEQKAWFKDRIPPGQSWQCYAAIILANRLAIIWIKELVKIETYSQCFATTNSRVYYLMSFFTKEKQQLFCDFLNTFTPEGRRDASQGNIQGETEKDNNREQIN